MHVLKVLFLLALTLAIMRLVSWTFLWLLGWVVNREAVYLCAASNVLALCAFAAFLVVDAVPGELLDLRALAFGVIVFGVFLGVDLRWTPRFLSRRFRH
jgi:hypothetical protein